MIQITQTLLRNLDKICEEHYRHLEPEIAANYTLLSKSQRRFIITNLKRILTGKPSELIQVNDEYIAEVSSGHHKVKRIYRNLSKVFNYKRFTKTDATWYCGYDLARKLNVNTCPYCNRSYTVTVAKGRDRTTRPDFDHFFSKNHYPLLALSFYNLVPSCLVCNRSVKNQEHIVYNKYVHPYEEGFSKAAKFSYTPLNLDSAVGLRTNYLVLLERNPIELVKAQRCEESFKLFKLKEIYEASHGSEIADVIRKHILSGGNYLHTLKKAFPDIGSVDELYRIAFGNYYQEEDLEKRPLSKLIKDVVDQLAFTFPTFSRH